MGLTLRVVLAPSALWVRGVRGGVSGVSGRDLWRARVPVLRRNSDGVRSVRCGGEDSLVESVAREENKDAAVNGEQSSSRSGAHRDGDDGTLEGQFGGWYGAEEEEKNTWMIASMQVATGFLLALGVAMSYYVWCQKRGRRLIPAPPTLTQRQLPSFMKRSPQEPEQSEHEENINVEESKEATFGNSFGKQSEESLQSDEGRGLDSGDVDEASSKREADAVDGEKPSGDAPQRTASASASNAVIAPRDQEKSSDSAKDNFQNLVSEPSADSTSLQPDKRTSTDSSNDGLRLPVAESTSEPENLRQDAEKTRKGGDDEPQLGPSQPRKPRKSQRRKKKFSAVQGRRGKVVVPAVVDPRQEQTVAVLQALQVMEEGTDPRAICKRRDYARWIIASSDTLTRSPAHKVFPAMYVEDATELAFADVTPDDPDFAYIQGLAEAGVIPSNFSSSGVEFAEGGYDSDLDEMIFSPDSPVSRQDLVSWKMALGQRSLPATDKEALEAKSGFLDIDRIEKTLWPALSFDLGSGEESIIASAFGLTRRFQPDKAATIGQAAIALVHGDNSERFGEELARFQAERLADEAVAADEVSEAQKQKELEELFGGQLRIERQQKEQAQKLFEELKIEFENMKEERDAQRDVLLKDKATVESEKELLEQLTELVHVHLQTLSMRLTQVSVEQEKLENLRLKSESYEEELSRLMSEVEVEKQALLQARSWAEDEARKARTHSEALEEIRNQRASRGREGAFSERGWRHSGTKAKAELENFLERAPLQDVMDKGEDLKVNVSNALIETWRTVLRVLNGFVQRVGDFLREVRWKTQHYYHVTSSSAGNLLQDSAYYVSQKFHNVQAVVSEFSTRVGDGTKNFANECKGGVEKLSRRFKN